jgi:hypothetical protein
MRYRDDNHMLRYLAQQNADSAFEIFVGVCIGAIVLGAAVGGLMAVLEAFCARCG